MLITLKPPFLKISLLPLYVPLPSLQTSLSRSCLFVLFCTWAVYVSTGLELSIGA